MATINNAQLLITTDRPRDEASIVVTCEAEFSEFEVNSMNLLGLRYTLRCDLLDMDMLYAPNDVPFTSVEFPRPGAAAKSVEQVEFTSITAMHVLHLFMFGKDTLVAQLSLINEETGDTTIRRTDVVRVDLAA